MSGVTSIYPKPEKRDRRFITETGTGGGKLTLRLNKDAIIKEHAVRITMTETFAGAPTAYLADEIGRLIEKAKLTVSGPQGGELFNLDGIGLVLHSRLYEDQAAPKVSLGTTTTARFGFELHYANDESRRDLMTALNGDASTQITLELDLLADITSVFTGGTTPSGAPTYDVEVVSVDYSPSAFVDPATGKVLDIFAGIASQRHFVRQQDDSIAGAGTLTVLVDTGNATRSMMIIAENASNALSDTVFSEVSVVIEGSERKVGSWQYFRDQTAARFGIDVDGIIVLDWGSDEFGFVNLSNVQQARVKLTATAAANARVVQDYTV